MVAPPVGRVTLRLAGRADRAAVNDAFVQAVCWRDEEPARTFEQLLDDAHFRPYVGDWGRNGDLGVLAHDERGNVGGAAWLRHFSADAPGYGYIADDVPEISLGLVSSWRNRGIGTRLMLRLHELAAKTDIRRLSLSVEPDNPAIGLYARLGYEKVGENGGAWTMVAQLH